MAIEFLYFTEFSQTYIDNFIKNIYVYAHSHNNKNQAWPY
jgi:hypothetical protein